MQNKLKPQFRPCQVRVLLTVLAVGHLVGPSLLSAANFTVTNPDDTGPGTLRQAVTDANNSGEPPPGAGHGILFDLPGDGPHIIALASELPAISNAIVILNDRAGDETVTVRRSAGIGTPNFRMLTVNPGSALSIRGLILSNGRLTSGGGGAILNQGTLVMTNCTVTQNSAAFGGAIYNQKLEGAPNVELSLSNTVLSENTALGPGEGGGAISNTASGTGGQARVSMTNCVLRQNSATDNGGALMNTASGSARAITSLTRCTLSDNSATFAGGALRNTGVSAAEAVASLLNCTLSGNQSGSGGGAVSNRGGGGSIDAGRVTLTNSTLSGNSAGNNASLSTARGGGGVENTTGTVVLTNCTFASNLVNNDSLGQSVLNTGGALVTTRNTLCVRNGIKTNFSNDATFTSLGHNLSNDAAGGDGTTTGPDGLLNATGDKRNTNPQIVALADNGGPTQTRALQAGSPAIDAGNDAAAPDLDQRGFVRVGVSDIGAFEFGGAAPTPTPTPTPMPSPTPTPTPVTTLANISTRLPVETGDNVLIGGFIVTGTQPKKVIVRAIGTSLALADKLADPTLELHGPNGLIEANDNWVDSPNKQAIIDSTIPPANDLESAIVQTLAANNAAYTAIVRGANGGTGIALVEAYDLDIAANSRLANISTRGFVQTGDNVLIAGTIVVGQASQRVIIRAIGPSLPIAGAMANPILELRDSSGTLLQENDNWVDSLDKQAIIDTTIPPTNDLESAIVAVLSANNASYTAIVRGVNDTSGIAVVEVYALP